MHIYINRYVHRTNLQFKYALHLKVQQSCAVSSNVVKMSSFKTQNMRITLKGCGPWVSGVP